MDNNIINWDLISMNTCRLVIVGNKKRRAT